MSKRVKRNQFDDQGKKKKAESREWLVKLGPEVDPESWVDSELRNWGWGGEESSQWEFIVKYGVWLQQSMTDSGADLDELVFYWNAIWQKALQEGQDAQEAEKRLRIGSIFQLLRIKYGKELDELMAWAEYNLKKQSLDNHLQHRIPYG